MRREDWQARLADTIAAEIRHWREERRLSAQQVVDRCESLGLPMKRTVLANLETGRRGYVTVAELFVLAAALGVPPILLLFPLGRVERIEALPDQAIDVPHALRWFTGETPFDAANDQALRDWQSSSFALTAYRQHTEHLNALLRARGRADQALQQADSADTEGERAALRRLAEAENRVADGEQRMLQQIRAQLRANGYLPPDLPGDRAPELHRAAFAEIEDVADEQVLRDLAEGIAKDASRDAER